MPPPRERSSARPDARATRRPLGLRFAALLTLSLGLTVSSGSASPSTAHANLLPLTDGRARIGERSWADVADPARRDARLLVREALALIIAATVAEPDGLEPSSQLDVERALDRLDRAAPILADDPELAFNRGVALSMFVREEASGRLVRRVDEAIAELERVREIDPGFAPPSVAWQLAILHTRAHRFERAAREYERARVTTRLSPAPVPPMTRAEEILLNLFFPPGLDTLATNQAEVEMLGGDLESARAHYQEAIDASSSGSIHRALALFGRSLAEERSGAHLEALASAEAASTEWVPAAQDALAALLIARHGPTAVLHHPGVSFEPRWERHAYEALAHEALAARASDPEAAQTERARAQRSLRAFFTVGGNASPYAEVARQALARIEADDIVVVGRVPTPPASARSSGPSSARSSGRSAAPSAARAPRRGTSRAAARP